MKVYIVLFDSGSPMGPPDFIIEKVFLSEQMAKEFEAQEVYRQLQVHDVIQDDPANDAR